MMLLVLPLRGGSDAGAAPSVSRLAGVDRFDTAVQVSRATFSSPVPVAFIANGGTYSDALAGTPEAVADGGPVLLVTTTSVPATTVSELARLRPGRIVVLGGPAAVSDPVLATLQQYTTGSVTREAGADRYATAAAISAATFSPGVGAAYVATDLGFADALSGAATAAAAHDPILIVQQGAVPAATATELTRLRPRSIVVLGGPSAVSDGVATSLAAFTMGAVSRVAGADRYATSAAVSTSVFPAGSSSAYLATGLNFPDALTGGVAAALAQAPLLLVPGGCVTASVVSEVQRLDPTRIVILGGDAAVAPAVESMTQCRPAVTSGCMFSSGAAPAFCDTFDQPALDPGTDREGQLNGTVWGASMIGEQGFSTPNGVANVQLSTCGSTALVSPPGNIQVCNGQLIDTVNDAGSVVSLAMYPKQPFDFAGRTGAIVFDVSNDTEGSHTAWPELWVTDQPVPDPFAHEATLQSLPRNGFGIRFAGCTGGGGNAAMCSVPNGVGVDSAITVSNYRENDSFNGGSLKVIGHGSVRESGPGQMNHYEVDVSQSQIDVWGTDAFTPGGAVPPLVHIATIPNADLSFTRGLVWIEDAHYNADKFGDQRLHAFRWDNVGFDGPVLPRDLGFDVADNTSPNGNVNGIGVPGTNLGWTISPNSSVTLTDPGVPGTAAASGALLTFGFYEQQAPITLSITVNGHPISVPWPYPDTLTFTPRTLAVAVPLGDLVPSDNTITFLTGGYALNVMNVDIILQGAGGVVAPTASS